MTTKCQDDLKEADEMVKYREATNLKVEKKREHAQAERDKARTDLVKA